MLTLREQGTRIENAVLISKHVLSDLLSLLRIALLSGAGYNNLIANCLFYFSSEHLPIACHILMLASLINLPNRSNS
jgi:hypothetical protein